MTPSRDREYTAPRLYEIAFDMNRKGEVDFLVHCFERYAKRPVKRVLDIACGTGPHLMRLAGRGWGFRLGNDLLLGLSGYGKSENKRGCGRGA